MYRGVEGEVIVEETFIGALDDIEGFERVWLVHGMDRVTGFQPRVVPYRDTQEHGLVATRSPGRPNPIGMSVVRLMRREGGVLHVADVDVLDGTPLLGSTPVEIRSTRQTTPEPNREEPPWLRRAGGSGAQRVRLDGELP